MTIQSFFDVKHETDPGYPGFDRECKSLFKHSLTLNGRKKNKNFIFNGVVKEVYEEFLRILPKKVPENAKVALFPYPTESRKSIEKKSEIFRHTLTNVKKAEYLIFDDTVEFTLLKKFNKRYCITHFNSSVWHNKHMDIFYVFSDYWLSIIPRLIDGSLIPISLSNYYLDKTLILDYHTLKNIIKLYKSEDILNKQLFTTMLLSIDLEKSDKECLAFLRHFIYNENIGENSDIFLDADKFVKSYVLSNFKSFCSFDKLHDNIIDRPELFNFISGYYTKKADEILSNAGMKKLLPYYKKI